MVQQIKVDDIPIEVVLKDIKNVHLRVYPPTGSVRISAPRQMSIDAIGVFATTKLNWIKRQRAKIAAQPPRSVQEMVSGETYYFQGVRYRLDVIEGSGKAKVALTNRHTLELCVEPGTSKEERRTALDRWYRQSLQDQIPDLLARWEAIVGVHVADCRIKKMRTKWGSCNINARRIWLNLELAKKPTSCLEYIVVHELVHMLERRHNHRFRKYLDRFLPDWRVRKNRLESALPALTRDLPALGSYALATRSCARTAE